MTRITRYNSSRILVTPISVTRASWQFAGKTVQGHDHLYDVVDTNFRSLNRWLFVVREPSRGAGNIVVQPRQPPGKRVWAGLERRSLVFVRGTRGRYRNSRYCKVSLADPSGIATKRVVGRGRRNGLPRWAKEHRHRMRLKGTVAVTHGNDDKHQVIVVKPEDYATMIKLFFALKVWTLQESFELPDAC